MGRGEFEFRVFESKIGRRTSVAPGDGKGVRHPE